MRSDLKQVEVPTENDERRQNIGSFQQEMMRGRGRVCAQSESLGEEYLGQRKTAIIKKTKRPIPSTAGKIPCGKASPRAAKRSNRNKAPNAPIAPAFHRRSLAVR
jgi:hypothetical protein